MAEGVTPGPLASMPLTTSVTPLVPVALSSRKRDMVERVAIDEVGVLVFRSLGTDDGDRNSGSDGDGFAFNRNLQSHAKGRLAPGCQGCVDAGVAETFGVKLQDVIAGCNVVETEKPDAVGDRLGNSFITRGK